MRAALNEVLGEEGMIDAAAVAGAFHGFVRVANATGIPAGGSAQGTDTAELRQQTGIDDFYAAADR